MKTFEFLGYEEIPGQNYLGVATIRLFLLDHKTANISFKIQVAKDGGNFFVSSPSYKKPKDGEEIWVEWFALDSRSQSAEIMAEIREHVKIYYHNKHADKFEKLAPVPSTPQMQMPPTQHWPEDTAALEARLPF